MIKTACSNLTLVLTLGFWFLPEPVSGLQSETKFESSQSQQDEPYATESGRPRSKQIIFDANEREVTIKIGVEEFTRFVRKGYDKPFFYPVYGPGQIGMTRNWPMKDGVTGEAHDHPHHKSMWFSHEVNGVDFWSEKDGITKVTAVDTMAGTDRMRVDSNWIRKDNLQMVFTDSTTYWFGFDERSRWIDAEISIKATNGDITFDDTKEGTFAMRTHPDLRLTADPEQGVKEVFGSALNSNGETGKEIWGKAAKWVCYSGPIAGQPMSIAIFDHPANLRHPTTWHARDYGLVAANPFGLHDFQGKPAGTGAVLIKNGEQLVLRYRATFIQGIATADDLNQQFNAFADSKITE